MKKNRNKVLMSVTYKQLLRVLELVLECGHLRVQMLVSCLHHAMLTEKNVLVNQ